VNLKNEIYSAYGICDLLSRSINHIDMRKEMNQELLFAFYQANPDLNAALRFAKDYLLFDDPITMEEVKKILAALPDSDSEKEGSQVLYDFEWADEYLSNLHTGLSFSAKELYSNILKQLDADIPALSKEKKEAEQPQTGQPQEDTGPHLEELLSQLNGLTGLENVKKQINQLVHFIQISNLRKQNGLKSAKLSHHLVFTGNPGTGKTTVARLLAQIYKELGVLSKGQLVETDRSGLVAGYIGQTAIKTKEMIDKAKGGILFIDEAYALAKESKNDFGQEAIDTLLKQMEDNREDFIVIAAGYPKKMEDFLNSNPGLKSRFSTTIEFEDYSMEQLLKILVQMAEEMDYQVSPDALPFIQEKLEADKKNSAAQFGNAREVRNLLEHALLCQASRLMQTSPASIDSQDLSMLLREDFQN
jgi:SpoVK/Ycf46/Vps4 family AAA+-type ATPase